jgi:nucleoside-diphosphate-sugar epimerase
VLGAGAPTTMATFAASIASALGVAPPRAGLPAGPFRLAQRVAALVFRLTGFASPYVHDREVLVADKRADSTRARMELGYDPRASLDDAVRSMVDGYVSSGALTRRELA